jgi:glycosyltransferase involved in cell wall biosynthesis
MLGRQNDKIKGAIYAVKAMDLIVKEIPDAVLYIITSDSRIQFLKNLTADLNLTKNIKIVYHTYDISKYFFNSSIHMFTSLSEAFPMAMNEGKAHGLPIVAFDVPISNPYQTGVITVDSLDYVALAQESIKLLKDYNYRKRMGELSKLSLSKFSNEKTVKLWEKLFQALREGKEKFRNLQKEVENKYYNETLAKAHLERHYKLAQQINEKFRCHTFENFTTLSYINVANNCQIENKTNNSKTS